MDALNRVLAPLRRRIDNLVARSLVTLVTDTGKLQLAQVSILDGEVRQNCERFQEYGFSSVPNVGAEAVVLFLAGLRDHPLIVAIDDRRTRKRNLQAGEVAIYTDQGDYLLFARDGHLTIHTSADVTIDAPSAHLTGDVTVDGNLSVNGSTGVSVANGDVVAGSIHLKTHKHTGVQTGGGQTGLPV